MKQQIFLTWTHVPLFNKVQEQIDVAAHLPEAWRLGKGVA